MIRSVSVVEGMAPPPTNAQGARSGRRISSSSLFNADNMIFIKRMPLTQVAFDELHLKKAGEQEEKKGIVDKLKSSCTCSAKSILKQVYTYLPIIKVLRYYKIKENILIDILSGITVGILHIPQALAFGLLTSVKVENGLYTSVWPVILYVIFGTSAHVSMGTSAVICIVTASVVDRQAETFKLNNVHLLNATSVNGTLPEWESIPEFMDFKENISLNIALFSGLILLAMGFLRLGFITAYLSESFFNAFTSGAAVHIATSQVPALLGINVPRFGGTFKIIYTYQAIFAAISGMHYVTPLIAVFSIATLFLVKECINERFKDKLFIPIPVELCVVIIATLLSYLIGLDDPKYHVVVVGQITSEIPPPILPNVEGIENYFVDCFVIAILIFANTIAMAKICAKKHNYEINDSQELIAYGMCNFLSSFLKCFPSAVAPPRSMVASSMNTKTTVTGVFVTILMLLVIMVMSALFQPLPKAALAAIIVVALKGLFVQMLDCRKFWRINKFDFIIWIFTITSVVFLDIDLGLGIGVVVSLITVVFQTQFARGYRVGKTMRDSILVEHKKYSDSMQIPGVKLFRFHSNLYFANAEIFRNTLYRATVNPRKLLKVWKKKQSKQEKEGSDQDPEKGVISKGTTIMDAGNKNGNFKASQDNNAVNGRKVSQTGSVVSSISSVSMDNAAFTVSEENLVNLGKINGSGMPKRRISVASLSSNLTDEFEIDPDDGDEMVSEEWLARILKTHHVIIDCSCINYLDASGANVLSHIYTEYNHVNIKLFLAGCSYDILRTMEYAGVFDKIPKSHFFIEVHDAIEVAKNEISKPLSRLLENFSDEEAAEESYITKI